MSAAPPEHWSSARRSSPSPTTTRRISASPGRRRTWRRVPTHPSPSPCPRPWPAALTVAWSVTTDTAVAADLGATSGSVTFPANSAVGGHADHHGCGHRRHACRRVPRPSASSWAPLAAPERTLYGSRPRPPALRRRYPRATRITISITGPSSVDEGEAATYTVSLSPDWRDSDV